MFKKFLLVITTIVVLFSFVTYEPKKVDAAAGIAAKVVAQQAIKAVTKTAVDSTVQRMLVKELLEEVTESYAKKQGYKLIESGGQKMYMKATYNETEKVLLKKQIDKVIDKEVYGNTPKFIKFLDWFVGVGAVIAVGQVLYATLTGEFEEYMSDIITEAMIDLGWLTPAQKVPTGATPSNPVSYPTSAPVYNGREELNAATDLSKTVVINERFQTSLSPEVRTYRLRLPTPVFASGLVYYMESMPIDSSGLPNAVEFQKFVTSTSSNDLTNFSTSMSHPLTNGFFTYSGKYELFKGGTKVTEFTHSSSSTSRWFDMRNYFGSDFGYAKYNRLIIQDLKYYPTNRTLVSRLILQDTYLRQMPDIVIQNTIENASPPSTVISDYIDFRTHYRHNPAQFPTKLKLGVFTDIDVALDTPLLPRPVLDKADLRVPIVTNENRVPIPNVSILPGGYVYDPTEQVIKDPNGQTVTDPESLPLPTPDPVITEGPEGDVEIDGTPTGVPVPPGGITPPTDGGGTGDGMTTGDPSQIDWNKLKGVPMILTKKFPFSLPWDAQRFMQGVFGDIPSAEEFSVKIDDLMGIHFGLNITLPAYFDGWFDFARTATTILFDLGLIYALYRLLGGAS